jgi:hypothetical protein
MPTSAETRFLETRERILARRNPEQLAKEDAEFRQMTDGELAAVARLPWASNKSTGYFRKHFREYFGGALASLLGLSVSYLDPYTYSILPIPLGPLLLSVTIARWAWGQRAARVAFVPMFLVGAAQLAQLMTHGAFPLWCICAMLTGMIIVRDG